MTAGNVAGIEMAEALPAEAKDCRHVMAGKGYGGDRLKTPIYDKGAKPVFPGRASQGVLPTSTLSDGMISG